jgi:hypothetical protein
MTIKNIFWKIYGVVHAMSSYKRLYFIGLFVAAGRMVARVFLNLWDMIE